MNTVLRLVIGMTLLLSFSVLAAWAWDQSDAQNAVPVTPSAVQVGVAGKPAD
ncbi:MAG: hypothetical protein ABJB17_07780 [Burkholderiales bacterium]